MALKREFYIKKGAMKIAPKDAGVVFYAYEGNGQFYAQCFVGRAQKPTWHYRFQSAEKREAKIRAQIEAVKEAQERKAKWKAEQNKPHGWEPGMILYSSWGYEQTNVEFYEVIEVIGKSMIRMELIGSQEANDTGEYGHGMANEVVPNIKARSGEIYRAKVVSNGAKGKYGQRATPWSGKPVYQSWYA